jgi:hypothetical protein
MNFDFASIQTFQRCVQSRFFLGDLREAFFMLAFFFGAARFLDAAFFPTFFFVVTTLLCPYRRGYLIPDRSRRSRSCSRGRSSSRSSRMGKLASQNFGPFGGAFACGDNSLLRTRFDALTRHIFHSPAETS